LRRTSTGISAVGSTPTCRPRSDVHVPHLFEAGHGRASRTVYCGKSWIPDEVLSTRDPRTRTFRAVQQSHVSSRSGTSAVSISSTTTKPSDSSVSPCGSYLARCSSTSGSSSQINPILTALSRRAAAARAISGR
jgi:hypothetical protein